jgi:hypothetical protein
LAEGEAPSLETGQSHQSRSSLLRGSLLEDLADDALGTAQHDADGEALDRSDDEDDSPSVPALCLPGIGSY